ncbi:hypothetical protein FRC12_006888 [Ceratobasidium sp. 428]|nr:hypothetical protein FRC12_006888 [Ceratobasidium sp. 428]
MARITHSVAQTRALAQAWQPQETSPIVPVYELPQEPIEVAPLIEEPIPHMPILPNAVDMGESLPPYISRPPSPMLNFLPADGLLLLPEAQVPLLSSLLGLQVLQDAQDI